MAINKGAICGAPSCEKPSATRGFCQNHYRKFMRYGDTSVCNKSHNKYKKFPPASEVFFKNLEKSQGCWLWSGAKTGAGYGAISDSARAVRNVLAHRWSYEFHKGPIPEGLVVNHLCEVRHCVNPEHLEACTHQENLLYSQRNERCSRGHLRVFLKSGGCRACNREMQLARRLRKRGEG